MRKSTLTALRQDGSSPAQGGDQTLKELAEVANIIDFAPAALARVTAAHRRESSARVRIETIAQANLAAQAQTHAAVLDLLEAIDHADLARRLHHLARTRLGLMDAVLAVENEAPIGWRALIHGQTDMILGFGRQTRMGCVPTACGLFSCRPQEIGSVALIRLHIWRRRPGVMALAATDPLGFTAHMGVDLITFLAKVTERCAGRWPPP